MKTAVRYYTQSGNTKKLAEAIASELGVEVKDVSCPLEEQTELLFLCNSVYWAGIDKRVKQFVRDNAQKIGSLVNVSTATLKNPRESAFMLRFAAVSCAASKKRQDAAGRGFFHINSHGGAEPCPFSPYSDVNIRGTSLREALRSPLFTALRSGDILLDDHAGGCVLYEKRELVEQLLSGKSNMIA